MKVENARIICCMLTSLDSLKQGNIKKSEKSLKIVITEGEDVQIDLRNFNINFRKNVAYDNIKSHKEAGFHSLIMHDACHSLIMHDAILHHACQK